MMLTQETKMQLLSLAATTLENDYYRKCEEKRTYHTEQVMRDDMHILTLPDTPSAEKIIETAKKFEKYVLE